MPVARTRAGLALVSLAVLGLELTLMRSLSLRFWSHLAYMVVGVALLGFGASGTAITLLGGRIAPHRRAVLAGTAMAMGLSIPASWWAAQGVELDVQFLAWSLRQAGHVLLIELLMLVPLGLGGAFVGVALTDHPRRVGGHYAANLAGSGAGAVAAVVGMYWLETGGLLVAASASAWLAGALLLPWRRPHAAGAGIAAAVGIALAAWAMPAHERMSRYKDLPQELAAGGRVTWHSSGPLGRIDVVDGPAVHYVPGLRLGYDGPIPPHRLLMLDGQRIGAVYDVQALEDWAFMDHTTSAAGYHLLDRPAVCVVGAGGGADVGLALFHRSPRVVALEMNPQIIQAMTGPLKDRGGGVYLAEPVGVENREARGYFAATDRTFDLIQLPALDAFGASGAGLYASQESYLYTVEAFAAMLGRLRPGGVLSVTRWARMPPREELRAFDIARQALADRGADPPAHLAMIRSMLTVTVLAFRDPISPRQADALRAFCNTRSFDLCWLPGMDPREANRFHLLDRPHYFQAARALLGPGRRRFLDESLFAVEATTDARPYFFHTLRLRSLAALRRQFGGASPAFLEAGYLMAVAALAQAVVLAAVLIVLPLVPRGSQRDRSPWGGAIRRARGKAASLGYFLLLGAGFMLLEMAMFQRLILYLAHPIYSAAAVIAGFLVFAAVGSRCSGAWRAGPATVGAWAAAAVAGLGLLYLAAMDGWLRATQAWPDALRWAVAALAIAPLAFAMGHLFPSGLRRLGAGEPALVPWAWAVNGFASVAATLAAPLLAMSAGMGWLVGAAVACYVLAGILVHLLPGEGPGEEQTR